MKNAALGLSVLHLASLGFVSPPIRQLDSRSTCICVGVPTARDQASSSQHAFVGIPIDQSRGENYTWRYTFWVEQGWRGTGLADTAVVLAVQVGDCGARFQLGRRYTVVAGDAGGSAHLGDCDSEIRYGSSSSSEILQVLGKAQRAGLSIEDLVRQLGAQTSPPDTALVFGQVISEPGGPAAGVTVELPTLNKRVLTDTQGGFAFTEVPVGAYVVRVASVSGSVEEFPLVVRCNAPFALSEQCASGSQFLVMGRPPVVTDGS